MACNSLHNLNRSLMAAALLLSGCTWQQGFSGLSKPWSQNEPDQPTAEDQARQLIDTSPQAPHLLPPGRHGQPPTVTPALRVEVPRSAPWLTDPIQVSYQNLPAALAIQQLAQQRPIKLTFKPGSQAGEVNVSQPLDATTIEDHLDAICQQANWSYEVHNGVVLVYDIETTTFPLSIQPGRSMARIPLRSLNNQRNGFGEFADNSSGGDDNNSNTRATNRLNVSIDPYVEELETLLRTLLGLNAEGGPGTNVDPRTSFSILPSANSVVVTARPQQMRLVETALDAYNTAASRSVVLRIAIFEVEINGGNNRSLDLNAIRDAAISVGVDVLPLPPADVNSSLSFLFNEGNRYDGSQAILNWLRTQGETQIAFNEVVEVRNNAVGSVDATQTRQYVSQIVDASEAVGGSTFNRSSVDFEELRTGWAVHVQPTINSNLVTVRLGISRSTFVDEEPYSFDDGRIQGTNFVTDDYNRVMAVSLQDGQTKMITSLSNAEDRRTLNRTPWLPWLGDGVSKDRTRRETVMVLTADVL